MASPLVEASAVDVLEEAVRALRERAMETFVDHWIGSVPFALGLLVFWSDMTRPHGGF